MHSLPSSVPSPPHCVDDESRRAFLAAVGLAATGSTLATPVRPDPSTVSTVGAAVPVPVLAHADLFVPPGESYVVWRVDPAATPLLAHAGAVVDGLDAAVAETSAFVARRGAHAPRYVETAALPAGLDRETVAAVDDWLVSTHGSDLVRTRTADGVAWAVTHDGWTEAVTLRAAGDWLLVVCAGGRADAAFAPDVATTHYADLLAGRAGGAA